MQDKAYQKPPYYWVVRLSYTLDDPFSRFKVNGGREGRPIGAYELAKAVEELGAGEILLNCIDCDGMLKTHSHH